MLCKGAVVSVCSTGCTTTSLQTAFDSLAACGDTIQIKSSETQTGNFTITYRGCDTNPITVTSDRAAAWLPSANARITPSHLANMAQIVTPNSFSAVAGILDGMNRPPAGWNFVGVAFSTSVGTYFPVSFNVQDTASQGCAGSGCAANSSQIADNITFDRCYFFMPSAINARNTSIQDVIRGDVTNLTVKNSFFGDAFVNGYVESHGLRMLTTAGPVTATNNFVVTSSSPFFSGGATPSYPTYLENGVTAQYNYFWRPWKYNGDPGQPYAADYMSYAQNTLRTGPWTLTSISNSGVITVLAGPPFIPASLLTIASVGGCTVANAANWRTTQLTSTTFQLLNFPGCNSTYTSGGTVNEYAITVCEKNLGEMKWGTGVTWRYNVGENSWGEPNANPCMSQENGLTDTVRTEWENPGVIFSLTNTTHITWTGTYRIGVGKPTTADMGLCLSMPITGTECHAIASFSGATLVASTAFSAAPAGTFDGWVVYTASSKLENVSITHNVYKNVDNPFSFLGLSFANGVGDAGFGKNHTISQNLAYVTTSYMIGTKGLNMGAAEADYSVNPTGYTIDHNTIYTPYGYNADGNSAFMHAGGTGCNLGAGTCSTAIQPVFTGGGITNNLFGVSAAAANGPFSGDGVTTIIDTTNAYFGTSNIKNNALPGATLGTNGVTGGNTVSGNILTSWADPFGGLASKGIFKLAPGSVYSGHGTDLRDVGVDFDRVPQISGVKVTAGVTAALLEFDLTVPIVDAGATQPCVLEVSSNRNLQSDLGSYTVVNDLNPLFFKQPDTSARTNAALPAVVVNGRHVYWPVGQNASVMGDDGAGHNLALAAGTTYYGRLMCYGDSQWFTFQTGSGGSNSVQYPLTATLQVGTTPGTTGVRLQYGATPALGGTTNFTPNGSGTASVALPLANGNPTYYKLQFLNGATVTYTGPTTVYLGGA